MNRQRKGRGGRRRQVLPMSRFTNLQNYTFRISAGGQFTSDGSGNISGFIYNDPTGSFGNYTEHTSYLANLFTEMRVLRSSWHLVSQLPFSINESKEVSNGVLAVGVWQRGSSGLPSLTSINQILDNQPSKLWACCSDTTGRGLRMSAKWSRLNYILTTATSQDYAGCPGGLFFYGSGFPASTACFYYHAEIFIQYRGRA